MSGETVLVIDDSPTILKVVQLVLTKARYRVETAADGEAGLELARATKPALILLDFVMPRMNGYQFCRELAGDPELKDIPIVLMSAKGDQVGERFVKVMGIVAYITKPFSPDAITEVVQRALAQYARAPRDGDGQNPALAEAEAERAEEDREARRAAEEAQLARTRALHEVRERIAELVAGQAVRDASPASPATGDGQSTDGMPGARESTAEDTDPQQIARQEPEQGAGAALADLAALTRDALADQVLADLIGRAAPAVVGLDRAPALSGNVRIVPVAQVLQLLDAQKQTGALVAQKDGSRVEIYFRRGRIDLAMSQGLSEEFLLGRFIVQEELMSREDFTGFLQSRAGNAQLIGTQLVKLFYISEADLEAVLEKQTCELIYEILRWQSGTFELHTAREFPFAASDAALGLDVEVILMEGFRRMDEWHLIESEIHDFDMVFLRNEDTIAQMGSIRLTREELTILELVNGKYTVKDIIQRSKMGSFEVGKLLYRLLLIKLIRRRVMPAVAV